MIPYLTGASNFEGAQGQVALSLGGYPSITPIQNDVVGNLLDGVSALSMQDGVSEYKAVAIKNTTGQSVTNIRFWMIYPENPKIFIKIGFENLQSDGCGGFTMQRVRDIRSKPYYVNFADISCTLSSAVMQLLTPATSGDVADILGVQVNFNQAALYTLQKTRDDILAAFSNNPDYIASAVPDTEDQILFEVSDPEQNSVLIELTTTGTASANPVTTGSNINNVVTPGVDLEPNAYLGVWFEKKISPACLDTPDLTEETCRVLQNTPYETQDYLFYIDFEYL